MNNNTPQTSPEKLFRIKFDNYFDIIDSQKIKETISKILDTHETIGNDVSIRKIDSLSMQRFKLESLPYTLKTSAEILEILLSAVIKLNDKPKEHLDLMNNISDFISTNIIDSTKEIVDDLNEVLEYEGNKN